MSSIVAIPIYIPATVQEGSLLSTPSPAFIVCRFFDDGILTNVRRYLFVVLICISPIMKNAEQLFMCLLAIFGKSSDEFPLLRF